MSFAFPAAPVPAVPIVGQKNSFPVHRIYCVGRNYVEHAQEMGATGREPPFFFLKPADTVFFAGRSTLHDDVSPHLWPYPTLTQNLHHEIELVVALGRGGKNIPVAEAENHIFGYAVGLDMTRRDLQNEMKKQGRPWSIGKGFDYSAPIGAISVAAEVPDIQNAHIQLKVNQSIRQQGRIEQLIWNIPETIAQLSQGWELQPGDLIFTGTPAGVGPVVLGDVLHGSITGLQDLQLQIA